MDFSNHRIKQTIDNRESMPKAVSKSIIDNYHHKFVLRFNDPTFDKGMTVKIIKNLSEADIEDLADYVDRKASQHKGKAFAKLCDNVIMHKTIDNTN